MGDVLGYDPDDLLALGTDELAILLVSQHRAGDHIHENNVLLALDAECRRAEVPDDKVEKILQQAAVAWQWLRCEGFVATVPKGSGGWEFVSDARNGIDRGYLTQSRNIGLLRQAHLDDRVRTPVMHLFRDGLYAEAVFFAMRTVEEAVRAAAHLSDSDIGTKLMADAFGQGKPLFDPTLDPGESQARLQLFMGAIGAYKNPPSHRSVNVSEPQEAAEAVLFANNLLRIVQRVVRAPAQTAGGAGQAHNAGVRTEPGAGAPRSG